MQTVDGTSPLPFYRHQGSGTPVIALHGSASTGGQWTSLMARLEHRHVTIAPDLPGYGASQQLASGTRSALRASARAIAEIAIRTGEPVHLVGHSYGGTVALKLATIWPELVRSLTLVEPAAFHFLRLGTSGDRAVYGEIQSVAGRMAAAAASDAPYEAMAGFVDYWNGEGSWARLNLPQRERLVRQLGAVLANFAAGFAETASLADCAVVDCPVQLIMGLQSRAPAQRVTEMLAEAMPDGRLAVIADAGHMMPVTHAGIVNGIIERHLAAVDEARRAVAA